MEQQFTCVPGDRYRLILEHSPEGVIEFEEPGFEVNVTCVNADCHSLCFEQANGTVVECYSFFFHNCGRCERNGQWWDEDLLSRLVQVVPL